MLSKSLNLLTPPLWHTPTGKANAAAWAVSLRTKWGTRGLVRRAIPCEDRAP